MDWTNPFIIGPLCMGAGVFVGMLLMRLLDGKNEDTQALAALRDEFNDYQTNVNEHFEQTSALFQGMTEKYRDVYNHLAAGAQQFGNSEGSPPRLEIVQPSAQLAADKADEAEDEPEETVAEAVKDGDAGADAADEEPEATEAAAADTTDTESDRDTQSDDKKDDGRGAFDASELDESELADRVEAEAESEVSADAEEPEADTESDDEPVRVARNTFRNMPKSDDESATSGSVNGTGKPKGQAESGTRKESVTQA